MTISLYNRALLVTCELWLFWLSNAHGEPKSASLSQSQHVVLIAQFGNGSVVRISLDQLGQRVASTAHSDSSEASIDNSGTGTGGDDVASCLYAGHLDGLQSQRLVIDVDVRLCEKALAVRKELELSDELIPMLAAAEQLRLEKRGPTSIMVNTYVRSLEIFFLINYKGYQHTFRQMTQKRITECISLMINNANILMQEANVALYPVGLHIINRSSDDPGIMNEDSLGNINFTLCKTIYNTLVRQLPQNKGKTIDTVYVLTDSLESDERKNIAGVAAMVGAICSSKQSTAFSSLISAAKTGSPDTDEYWAALAITMAHEIAHLMDINHDSTPCNERIMCAIGSFSSSLKIKWSPKSLSGSEAPSYNSVLDSCMANKPTSWSNELLPPRKCGNGILEDGELCDCGLPTDKKYPDYCAANAQCLASSCTLTLVHKSQCWTGPCCEYSYYDVFARNLLPSGTPCRNESLTGYYSIDADCYTARCNGKSSLCEVSHVENGRSCDQGNGYCLNGRCKSMQFQCELAYSSVPMTSRPGNTTWKIDQLCNRWTPTRAVEMNPAKEEYRDYLCSLKDCPVYANYTKTTNEEELANLRCQTLMCMNDRLVYNMKTEYGYFSFLRQQVSVQLYCVHYNNSVTLPPGGSLKNFKLDEGTKCAEGKACKNGRCQVLSAVYPSLAAATQNSPTKPQITSKRP